MAQRLVPIVIGALIALFLLTVTFAVHESGGLGDDNKPKGPAKKCEKNCGDDDLLMRIIVLSARPVEKTNV